MKRIFVLVSAATLLGAVSAASAHDVQGVVKSIDEAKNRITLQNGEVFALEVSPFAGKLNPGDVVDITWYTSEHGYKKAFDVDLIMKAKSEQQSSARMVPEGEWTRGVIRSIDTAKNTITLASGDVFALGVAPFSGELVPGDVVQVKWWRYDDGGYKRAYKLERIHAIPVQKGMKSTVVPMGSKIEGGITNINAALNMITLDDGATFALGTSTGKFAGDLKKGAKVELEWNHWRNGYRVAEELKVISQ